LLKPVQQEELLETIYRVMSRPAPDKETRRQGDKETRRQGDRSKWPCSSLSPCLLVSLSADPGGRGQRIQRATHGAPPHPGGPPRAAGDQRPGGADPAWDQGSGIRSQGSEVRSQESGVRSQKSEVRSQ